MRYAPIEKNKLLARFKCRLATERFEKVITCSFSNFFIVFYCKLQSISWRLKWLRMISSNE